MARQEGIIRLTGTVGSVTYYKMNGEYHARLKSSLTGKKFWKHKAFEASRRSCRRFALGNHLASQVYRQLPPEKRLYSIFCQLKTAAIHYIRLGYSSEQTNERLQKHVDQLQFILPLKFRKKRNKKPFPYAVAITKDYIAITGGRIQQLLEKYSNEQIVLLAHAVLTSRECSPPVHRQVLCRA